MNALKKSITILGVVVLALLVALVVVALYALNRKEQNYQRIAPAAANRHPKPKANEESISNSQMVVTPGSGGDGDLPIAESVAQSS